MFELNFLGTAAAAPSVSRNVASTLLTYREYRFLIDAGEGTQRQLLKSGLGFRKLEHILLTHAHLDHILGLAGIVSTLNRWDVAQQQLNLYGSPRTLNRVRDLLMGVVLKRQKGGMRLEFIEVGDGPFLENNHFTLSAFPVHHRASESVGYCFQAQPSSVSDHRSRGVRGTFWTGAGSPGCRRVYHTGRRTGGSPRCGVGATPGGIKLVYIGDVDHLTPLRRIIHNADAVVMEATYAHSEADLMASHGHITARMAALFAKQGNIGALYLNHISGRYQGSELEAEARQVFANTWVVKDFDSVVVQRKAPH